MPRQEIPFNGPTLVGRSSKVQASDTINLYPESTTPGSKSSLVLYSDPGLNPLQVKGIGPCRSNGVEFQDELYFVNNTEVIKFDQLLNPTSVGTIDTPDGRVHMAADANRLIIVDGTQGKEWDGTNLTNVASANFPDDATHITIIDGYWVANNPSNTGRFHWSSDGVTWNAVDFATAQGQPDALKAVTSTQNDLIMLGAKTTEVWNFTGSARFPFQRHPNGVKWWGIAAPHSVSVSSLGVFFLANVAEGEVKAIHLDGLNFNIISDAWLDWQIGQMDVIDDAFGFVYQMNGQWYWVLTFPYGDRTFLFSLTSKQWHRRKTFNKNRFRATGHGFLNRTHIVGEGDSGQWYKLDFKYHKDGTLPIERIRRAPVIHKSGLMITYNEVIIEFEAGTGNTTGEGEDPTCYLRYSDDGGGEWSSWLKSPIGKQGKRGTLSTFRKLGMARERIFEMRVTDPVNITVVKAYADVELSDI